MAGQSAIGLNTDKSNYSSNFTSVHNSDLLVVDVIIPALNEAEALPYTLGPLMDFVNGTV